jgi:RimJ/RimL family protein N-acetyltransferase/quercetin dioxygenase-like cupin family protein
VTSLPDFPLHTERLELRPLTEADAPDLAAYRALPEVCRYVPFEPMDAAAIRERIAGGWSRGLGPDDHILFLGAQLVEGGPVIGDLMLRWATDEHRSGEVGYVFHPAHSGRGYATEAVHGALHLAFDDLSLHRVTARVDLRNSPSVRLASRLGMREEAHLRENEWFKGGWSDEIGFAMLEDEWRALHVQGCPDLRQPAPVTVVAVPDLAGAELRDADVEIYDRPIGVRLLYRHPVTGADHYLIRYPPGLVARTHRHRAAHTFVVLEGTLLVDGERIGPGSYCHFPAGSVMHHAPAEEDGCLFVAIFDGPQDVEPVTAAAGGR